YGLTALVLERLKLARSRPWRPALAPAPARVGCYVVVIYAAEYLSGAGLASLLGRCPWDYGDAPFAVAGLVRLDYAPLWVGVACAFDALQGPLDRAARAIVGGPRGARSPGSPGSPRSPGAPPSGLAAADR